MPIKKPIGITIFAGLFIVAGGFSAVVIIVELIDSIRFYGMTSIGISGLVSLFGFIVYAGAPLLLYSSGVGLFLSRPWAWKLIVYVMPLLLFFFFANLSYRLAVEKTALLLPTTGEVIYENIDVFINVFIRYAFLVAPVLYYFTRPIVVLYFEQFLPQKSKFDK